MTTTILELGIPAAVIVGLSIGESYMRSKYPKPRALGGVLRQLVVVDADEILQFKETFEQEWEAKPYLRRILRRKRIVVYSAYYGQMASNALRFQQVVRFEELKIDSGKSSFDYEPREVLITDLLDEIAELRSEIFEARVDLLKGALIGRAVDETRLQALLGDYKTMEHGMVELANMAKDKTCRDMLIERLGLTNWQILRGGSEPEPA